MMKQSEKTKTIQYQKPFTLSKPGEEIVNYWNVVYPGFENRDKLLVKVSKWNGITQVEKGEFSKSKLIKFKVFIKYEDGEKLKEKME